MTACKPPCPFIFTIPEIAFEVAKHLDTTDLASVVRVDKHFFSLFTPTLWRTIAIERGINNNISLSAFQGALARYGHHYVTTLWINTSNSWLVQSGLSRYCRRLDDLTLALDSADDMGSDNNNDHPRTAVDQLLRNNHAGLRYLSLSTIHLSVAASSFAGMHQLRFLHLSFADLTVRDFFKIVEHCPLLEELSCRYNSFDDGLGGGEDEEMVDVHGEGGGEEGNNSHNNHLILGGFHSASSLSAAFQDFARMATIPTRLQNIAFAFEGRPRDVLVLCQLLYIAPHLTELELILLEESTIEMICYALERTCPNLQLLSVLGCYMHPPLDSAARLTVACRNKPLKSLDMGSFLGPWSPHNMRFDYLGAHLEQLQLCGVYKLEAHDHEDEGQDNDSSSSSSSSNNGSMGRSWIQTLLETCTQLRSLQIYARRRTAAKFVLESMAAVEEWHCRRIEELAVVFPPVDEDAEELQSNGSHVLIQGEEEHEQGQPLQQPTPPPSLSAVAHEAVELHFIRKVKSSLPGLRHLCLQGYHSEHPGLRIGRLLHELHTTLRGPLTLLSIPRCRNESNEADEALRTWLDEQWPELTVQGLRFLSSSTSPSASAQQSRGFSNMKGVNEISGTDVGEKGAEGGVGPQFMPPRPGEDVPPARCWGVDWRGGDDQ